MTKHIGLLTSGGDCPGLNAAIRGVGKAAQGAFGMPGIGFRDDFRGEFRVTVADRGDGTEPVPLEKVAGKRKTVPLDHRWITSTRLVGTRLGD